MRMYYNPLQYLRLTLVCCFCFFELLSLSSQPTCESYAVDETGGSGSYVLSAKPSGVEENNLLLAVACYESGNSQTVSSPAGWTLIEKTDHSSNIGVATFFKVASTSDVEASTFSFTLSEDKKWTLGILRISGANTEDPIGTHSGNSGAGGNPVAMHVITSEDSCMVLSIYGNKKDATYEGFNDEEYEIEHSAGQIASQMVEYFIQSSAGNTGNTTAIPTQKDAWAAQMIAIRKSDAVLLNNFKSIASGSFEDNSTWARERSDGTWKTPSDIVPPEDANVTIQDTHLIVSTGPRSFLNSQITIETGGSLFVQN